MSTHCGCGEEFFLRARGPAGAKTISESVSGKGGGPIMEWRDETHACRGGRFKTPLKEGETANCPRCGAICGGLGDGQGNLVSTEHHQCALSPRGKEIDEEKREIISLRDGWRKEGRSWEEVARLFKELDRIKEFLKRSSASLTEAQKEASWDMTQILLLKEGRYVAHSPSYGSAPSGAVVAAERRQEGWKLL